jgi:DNA-binding CsgD family transcriptional regulator
MDPDAVELVTGQDGLATIRHCLADLAEGLNCSMACLLLRSGEQVSILAAHGLGTDAAEAYAAEWHRHDPCLLALHGPFGGRAFRGEDLVSPRALRISDFNLGWLEPHGFGPGGLAEVAEATGTVVLLQVLRPARAKPLARQDVLVLRAVAGALGIALRRFDLSAGAAAAAAILGRAPTPVVLMLADGTVIWSNIAAAALWAPEGPLRRSGRRLAGRGTAPNVSFLRALGIAAVPTAKPHLIGLAGGAGAPIPARFQPLTLRSGRTLVLMAAAPPSATVPTADAVATTLGLTRSQAEVAVLLCRGLETAAISQRIGISQNTLNGHLRDLYLRLSAANRVQAVVRLLGATAALALFSEPAAGPRGAEGESVSATV